MTLGEWAFGSKYTQAKQQLSAKQQSSPSSSAANKFGSFVGALQGIAGQNSAASAKQAEALRAWQEQQSQIARKYNSEEAQKNRDWQERMSSTAHQREVRDLIAAGLNPVLSVTGGNGASVTSGATASSSAPSGAMGNVDNSATGAIAGLFGSLLSSLLSLEATRVSAQSNQAIADKYTAMSKYTSELSSKTSKDIAGLQAQTQLSTANIQAMASKYVSDNNLKGTKYAADKHAASTQAAAAISAAATRYAADKHLEGVEVSSLNQYEIAELNGEINKELQARGFKQQFDIKSAYPENFWELAGSVGDALSGQGSDRGFGAFQDMLQQALGSVSSGKNPSGKFKGGGAGRS